jgi:hypothetical protein
MWRFASGSLVAQLRTSNQSASVVPIADVARSIAGAMSMAAGMTARMR